jgi:ABC-2 type transport system permease protein
MIANQPALIKRELWEHRSIYITPAAIAIIVTLGVLAMLMMASGFAKELDLVIFGAQNMVGDLERRAVLTGFFVGTSWVFLVAVMFLTVFYSLDSLYAERKDKSILFWRSMPTTDAEVVISKLLTAAIVIPVITAVGIWATHLVNLIVTSIWVSAKGGDAGVMIWGSWSWHQVSGCPRLSRGSCLYRRGPSACLSLWHSCHRLSWDCSSGSSSVRIIS